MQLKPNLLMIGLCLLSFSQALFGQDRNASTQSQAAKSSLTTTEADKAPFFHITAYLYVYRQFNNRRSRPNRGGLGGGVDFDFSLTDHFGLMARLQFTEDHYLGIYAPLYFSPRVVVYQNQYFRTLIHAGLGPAFGIGADTSGPLYAAFNSGLRVELGGNNKQAKFSFGLSYSQADAFGSEDLHYINLLFGVRF